MWKIRRAMEERQRGGTCEGPDDEDSEALGELWQRMGEVTGLLPFGEDGVRDDAPHQRGELRARKPARAPVPAEGEACGDADGEGAALSGGAPGPAAPKEKRGAVFEMTAKAGLLTDYEYRGQREPLRSMGLYHYAMYVWSTERPDMPPADDDFLVYSFDPGHPQAAERVQRLRAFGSFRVPLLEGWTHNPEEKSPELNAAYKAVLLHPIHGPAGYGELCSSSGSVVEPWRVWFREQMKLAEQGRQKQGRAGKLHTIADVLLEPAAETCTEEESLERPTPAEFFAGITVAVATNLDLIAEARRRPKRQLNLRGAIREEQRLQAAQARPGGDGVDLGGAEKRAGPTFHKTVPDTPRFAVGDAEDVDDACLFKTKLRGGDTNAYRENFLALHGRLRRPQVRWQAVPSQSGGHGEHSVDLDGVRTEQGRVFEYRRKASGKEEEQAEDEDPRPSTRVRRNVAGERFAAEWIEWRDGESPGQFAWRFI
jgi:hypothetical protein